MNRAVLHDNLSLTVTDDQWSHLEFLLTTHLKWNQVYNLSAHRTANDVFLYQIVDSLTVHAHVNPGNLLDVGTGPGFPGLPLAIVCPDVSVCLLDSNDKKLAFARHIVHQLNLKNVTVAHSRIEQFQPSDAFDQIISRAFTDLDGMIEATKHLLAPSGSILAMKGSRASDEVKQAQSSHSEFELTVDELPHAVNESRVLVKATRKQP